MPEETEGHMLSVAEVARGEPRLLNVDTIELSVVIPACNEEARIGSTLETSRSFFDRLGIPYEVIIVDDGSRDATRHVVESQIDEWPQARLLSYRVNRGKGHALRTGIAATLGQRVLFMDADLSTPLDEIPRAIELLDRGLSVVIGSRSALGAHIGRSQPFYRRWGSKLFNQIRDGLLGLADLGDTQCGFKAFQGQVARELFGLARIDRWMFDAEVLYLARRMALDIEAMPVRWADVQGSKLRLFRDTAHMFRDLLRIRMEHRGVARRSIRPVTGS